MGQIVKYHNDFNRIRISNFGELEQNLLFGIIYTIQAEKEKGGMINNEITIYPNDLSKLAQKNLTRTELNNIVRNLRDNFLKADFTHLVKKSDTDFYNETINLFERLRTHYNTAYDKEHDINFTKLEIKVTQSFQYLIYELIGNFTSFELIEFIFINGKYTKTLYRLLKQYKNTGYMRKEWQEFCKIMDIPLNYKQANIDQKILNPAIKELTKENNLFDAKRIPFENLTYKKIKGKGRGRGGNVIGIEFSFKPLKANELENKVETLEKENEALKAQNEILNNKNKDLDYKNVFIKQFIEAGEKYGNFTNRSFINEKSETIKILKVYEFRNPLGQLEIYADLKNCENEKFFNMKFESVKHLENYLKQFALL